ncbi:hypothetical protein [Gallaecimonas sp. GXIMD4217]|uniref:hypothetical protein n=1 Tax=Gallaecimonas sp. GXIMD4217 TaxID=3131927 RepID=UPI00311B406A
MKAWICVFALLSTAAQAWPSIDFPDGARVEVAAEDTSYNGFPMRTWVMHDRQSQMMTAAFFRKQWKADSELFDEQMFQGDYIINSLQPPYLLTARIANTGSGVTAYVGITQSLEEHQLKTPGDQFPMPAQTRVLTDQVSTDLYKQGRTLVLSSDGSVSSLFNFYQSHYRRRGWVDNGSLLDPAAGKGALLMSRDQKELNISIERRQGKSYLVVNSVSRG